MQLCKMSYIHLTVPDSIEYDPEIWRAIKEEEMLNWLKSLETTKPAVIAIETFYTDWLQEMDWQSLPNIAFVQNDINWNKTGNDKVTFKKHKAALNLVRQILPHGCVGFVDTDMSEIMDLVEKLGEYDYCGSCAPAYVTSVEMIKISGEWIAHVSIDTTVG